MSSYRIAVSECKPLIDTATKGLFRINAFRITGLPVDATAGEIRKRIDKLKIMEDLGQGQILNNSPFALRPSPTCDQIREALHRLQDPEKRLIDEFFWFWPEEFGRSRMDPAIQALLSGDCDTASKIWTLRESSPSTGTIATHNTALFWHFTALEREYYAANNDIGPAQEVIAASNWNNAIQRWRYLFGDGALWEVVDARVRQINDARLPANFGARMRAAMPLAFAKIHAELALAYVERGRLDLARVQVTLLRELAPKGTVIEMAADLVLAAAKRRLQANSKNVKDEATRTPDKGAALARTLMAPTLFLFEVIELFFGEADYVGKEVLDETLSVCLECAVLYQRKTGDNDTFVDLLERLRPLGDNPEINTRIAENLRIGKKNVEAKQEDVRRSHSIPSAIKQEPKIIAPTSVKRKSSWLSKLFGKK